MIKMIKAKMMPIMARSSHGLFAGSDGVTAAVLVATVAGAETEAGVVGVGRGRVFD